jgi:hypothetical protein
MEAMRSTGRNTLTSIESQLLLLELYDRHFEIAKHDTPLRPMSLVGLHPKETVGQFSRRHRVFRRFAALGIGDLFNISINEFLNQSREDVELMFEIAEDKTIQEDRKNSEIKRSLEQTLGGSLPK